MRKLTVNALPLASATGVLDTVAEAQFLGPQQANQLPASPADHRIHYAGGAFQFADLRLPKASGRHPVAVVVHGGCWMYHHGDLTADLQSTAALSSALTKLGIATWNVEYRQIDIPGGGWPGTFEDVAKAVDHLRVLAKSYPLDLERVVIIGHSAGGHLGTWAAARHRLPERTSFSFENPLRVAGVVNLAGPADLEAFIPIQNSSCGQEAIITLVGGSPSEVPDRYQLASPSNLLPTGVKQILISGAQDTIVPPQLSQEYADEANKAGDDVTFTAVENAAHFEVIAPGSEAWSKVEDAVLSILKLKK